MQWKKIRLEEILQRKKIPVRINEEDEYSLVTIRMYHKGIVERERKKGSNIKSSMYGIKSGQFILSGIDARHGAFGIVPEHLDGAIITNDFWAHDINTEIITPEYFYWFTSTPQFYNACIRASEGTTNRQRLQASKFYAFEIEIPPINEQVEIVTKVNKANTTLRLLNLELEEQTNDLKLLRQSILQEAIQGKLVSQDPTDEPAYVLLERIKKEKQRLINAGLLKKERQLAVANEVPFEIPDSWEWTQLSKVGVVNPRNSAADENKIAAFIPMKDISEKFNVPPIIQEKKWVDIKSGFTHFANNDIAIAKITPCFENSKAAIFKNLPNGMGAGTTELHVFRCLEGIEPGYVYLFFKSDYFLKLGESKMTGSAGQKRVPTDFVKSVGFPLPPQKEQQLIVSKVAQLMSLCDEMEQQIIQGKTEAEQLLQAVLREAFEGKHTVPKQAGKQDEIFWQKQLLASYINLLMEQHQEQGEMAIAKYTYLNDRVHDAGSRFKYVQHNFGPYSPEIKDCLTAPDALFYKKTVGKKGYEVYYVNKDLEADFIDLENPSLQEAQKGFSQLMQVFSIYPRQERARQLELVASICWLIEQQQSTDLDTIYEGLENWPTPKRQVQHKGQLFTKPETAAGLQLIQQQGWHLKLLHTF